MVAASFLLLGWREQCMQELLQRMVLNAYMRVMLTRTLSTCCLLPHVMHTPAASVALLPKELRMRLLRLRVCSSYLWPCICKE